MRYLTWQIKTFKVSIYILAIESSCDETAVAISKDRKICANIIASQEVHSKYGGVVPELASRAHIQKIVPVVQEALQITFPEQKNYLDQLNQLSAIAFTQSPGLIGSLLVGAQFAKSLAWSLEIPLISVNHLQAHVLANLIDKEEINFPFLCLTVSGGHTQIVLVKEALSYQIIGETIDDAAGEAFDKIGKLLNLPYPAGPHIDKLAKFGNPTAFKFPIPKAPDLNFSFSGLKTSVYYFLQKQNPDFINQHLQDICASVQQTIIDSLLKKLKKAADDYNIKDVYLAGGVSANSALRKQFSELGVLKGWRTQIPKFEYCTDNAGMIAMVAQLKYKYQQFANLDAEVSARSIFN